MINKITIYFLRKGFLPHDSEIVEEKLRKLFKEMNEKVQIYSSITGNVVKVGREILKKSKYTEKT